MKKITLSLLLVLSTLCLSAQDRRQWGTYYGSTASDFGYAVANDASGNSYLAGVTLDNTGYFGSGGFQNSNGGGNDAYLVKFDAAGNRVWSTYYGGTGTDQGYAVVVDQNGDVYLAGYTNSSNAIASMIPPYAGNTDAFIAKFDGISGTRLWGRYFGSTGAESSVVSAPEIGVTTDQNGNVILTGRTSSGVGIATIGAHQTVYGTNGDAFIAKFDGNGTILWSTYYGGAGGDAGYGVVTDAADNIFVTGYTNSGGSIATLGAHQTVNGGGGNDAFLVKFDKNGVRSWGTYYGGGGQDEGRAIALTDTNIYITGRTMSGTAIASLGAYQTVYGGGGNYDAYLVQFDSTGTRNWGTYYGTASDDRGYGVASDEEGNSYMAGRTSSAAGIASPGGFQTVYGTNNDAMLIKFNWKGNRLCGTYLGGIANDQAMGVSYFEGRIYLAGYTQSASGIAGGSGFQTIYGGSGNSDAFLAKFTSCIPTTTMQTNALCNGSCDGTGTVNPTGATLLPYSYFWTGGQTTQTATGLCAGKYYVNAMDAWGNTGLDSVTITEPTALTTTVNTLPATCGNSDGAAGVNVSGGTGSYTYSWAPGGETTQVVTGLTAGVYTVTVFDANSCSVSAGATVTSNGPSVSISSSTNITCNGANDGTADASVTGGTPMYTYAWSPSGGSTSAATGLTAQDYTVLVTDGAGCTATATVTIAEPAALTTTVNGTNTSCGQNNGTASANVSGGTGSYTYSWAPSGGTNASASGLAAGNYTVTVNDMNSCMSTATVTIGTSAGPTVTISSQTNVPCNGGNTGSANTSVSGGTPSYTYSWTTSPVQTTPNATGLSAGGYIVTVTDGSGCTSTATVIITQPTALTATIVSTTNSTCGNSDGTATVSASGGTPNYTYAWSTTPIQFTPTATGLPAGTYTAVVLDANSCTVALTCTVTNSNGPSVSISSQTNVLCNGGSTGSANTSVSGGQTPFTYSWTTAPVQTTANATGLAAGTYSVTLTDANGCSSITSVTITQPAALTATVSSTNAACGNNNGTASASGSGGTSPYTYAWSTSPVQFGPTATGLASGNYTVTVLDANSCAITATVNVGTASSPTVSISGQTNVSCNGGSNGTASSSVTGGTPNYSYSWTTAPAQTTANASGLSSGNYTVTVTDMNGCTSTTAVSITQPAAMSATVMTTPSSCSMSTGTASVNVSGGTPNYTYAWTTAPVQTTANATGLAAGSYTVNITDANGCAYAAFANVMNSNGPNVTIASQINVSCNGGSNGFATANVTGGTSPYTYAWTTAPVQTTSVAAGLSAGTYSVTVADANGCTSIAAVTITEPAGITTTVSVSNGNCTSNNGSATVTASGGTPSYTYAWTTSPVQTSPTATGLAAGTYTVTITDSNGCTHTDVAVISVTGAPAVNIASSTNVSCNGGNDGTASASASGGTTPYTYSWTTVPAQTTANATGLTAGNYTVTVTDANGCTGTTAVTITQPAGMNTTMGSTAAGCGVANGSASVNVSGGNSPYTYAWSTAPVQTTPTATGLFAGTYSVTVTDASGCTKVSAVTVVNYNGPIASIQAQTNVSCFGGSDGSASATATGATPPYTYSWNTSPVQNAQTATGLSAGQYTCTVSDALGCISITVVAITEPSAVSVSASPLSNASCSTCCDGTASSSASGGTAPYSYSWSTFPVQSTQNAIGLCGSGTYTVCVTDANGCTACSSVTIPFNPPTGISSVNQNAVITVFPNPANDYLFVEGTVAATEKLEVKIVNLFGQVMQRNNFTVNGKFSEKLNTENLPGGIYFIEIKSDDITRKLKIIIQ